MHSRRAFVLGSAAPVLTGQTQRQGMFANAEAYERFMGRWSRLVAPQLVDFATLPARGRILDAGSGTGSLAFAIAQRHRGTRIVGIDPSKEYVAFASARNSFPDRARFAVGDAQQLSDAGSSFDAAVSLLVFNFIPDPRKALGELRRVTKSGGSVTAAVWDYGDGMRMLRIFWDAATAIDPSADKLDEKHMPLCRFGQLAELWRQGSLMDVREQAIDINMRFESFADYWDPFLLGQGPAGSYTRSLGGTKLDALREEIKRLIPASENGPFNLPARVWAVRGVVPARATA